ncbi:MAG TPA: NUDIX domain-containing protein [Thermoplasmata archaeon]|nr:NUDIX domain-containing protein [Thermoplasmata archaeon]
MDAASSRRFARYRPVEGEVAGRKMWAVPRAGVCLSVFVLVGDPKNPNLVILGRPAASASWAEIGSLEPAHLETLQDRWLLPASHLVEFESPRAAAERVAREQLGLDPFELRGPEVFSETYPSRIDPESGNHWDLHFLFRGDWPRGRELHAAPWKELRLIDTRTVAGPNLGRGHGDILILAGYPLGARIT